MLEPLTLTGVAIAEVVPVPVAAVPVEVVLGSDVLPEVGRLVGVLTLKFASLHEAL